MTDSNDSSPSAPALRASAPIAGASDADRLRAFARDLFKDWPEALGVDGFELQDLAEKHGLLARKEPAPLVACSENCACASYYGNREWEAGEVVCYQRTPLLTGNGPAPADARPDTVALTDAERQYPAAKYSKRQAEWCRHYQHETTFEPLMEDYEAGNETFIEAAKKSIAWFEGWSSDAFLRCTSVAVPGGEFDAIDASIRAGKPQISCGS